MLTLLALWLANCIYHTHLYIAKQSLTVCRSFCLIQVALNKNRNALIFDKIQLAIWVVRWNTTIVPLLLSLLFAKIYQVMVVLALWEKQQLCFLVSTFLLVSTPASCCDDELWMNKSVTVTHSRRFPLTIWINLSLEKEKYGCLPFNNCLFFRVRKIIFSFALHVGSAR